MDYMKWVNKLLNLLHTICSKVFVDAESQIRWQSEEVCFNVLRKHALSLSNTDNLKVDHRIAKRSRAVGWCFYLELLRNVMDEEFNVPESGWDQRYKMSGDLQMQIDAHIGSQCSFLRIGLIIMILFLINNYWLIIHNYGLFAIRSR